MLNRILFATIIKTCLKETSLNISPLLFANEKWRLFVVNFYISPAEQNFAWSEGSEEMKHVALSSLEKPGSKV